MNRHPLWTLPHWSVAALLAPLLGCGAAGGSDASDDPSENGPLSQFANPSGNNSSNTGNPGTNQNGTTTPPAGAGTTPAPQNGNGSTPGGAQTPAAGTGNGSNEGSNVGGQVPGNAAPGNANPGGAGPGAGGTGGGADPGDGTADPDPGGADPADAPGFTSVDVNGGASAAFVCPEGAAFGNPLTGMGAVQQVGAPAGSFFAFIEGPIWVGSLNRLFFSDNASGPERIWQISAPFTTPSVFMANSGSNGLAIDNTDQLLLADQAGNRITRVSTNNAQVSAVLVPAGNFNPNDLVMRSDSNLYFTDPAAGFFRVSPGGEVSAAIRPAAAPNAPNSPNGVVLSPDENTLYVGDVNAQFISSFALRADGSLDLASGQVFARTRGTTVDGMAVDCAGNVYAGTQSGVEVYSPAGELLGTVPTGEASNATFGGTDRRTLFVTSRSVLKYVTLAVPGLPD